MKAVILAAGKGKKLQLTDYRLKAMLPICNKHSLPVEMLRRHRIDEIAVVGYLEDTIRKHLKTV